MHRLLKKTALPLALALAAMVLLPVSARAEIISLECSGDVTGTFTFDLSAGTGATYDDNRTIDLTDVEISQATIVFSQDDLHPTTEDTVAGGTSSRFRIDRQTDAIERSTYQYLNNKVTGESHAVGQCKKVPTPHNPL